MQATGTRPGISVWQDSLGAVLRDHRAMLACVLAYALLAVLVAEYHGMPGRLRVAQYSLAIPVTTGFYLLFFFLVYLVYVMTAVRPARLTAHIAADLRGNWLGVERVAGGLLAVLVLQFFLSLFTSLKAMIPVIQPFAWDATFAAWDRALHGGVDPWRLLQPVLGHPAATTAVNFLYQCWLFVLYGILVWQAFLARDRRLRMQFLLSFVLSWALLGSLAATLLSSAGPVYFGRVTGLEDPYLPLLDYLRAADQVLPVWALEVQDRLWAAYAADGEMLGKGISAMPSIHVASSVLFALVAWRANRVLGWVFWAYAAAVMLGSVHLAWHYALDGYLGAALTVLVWRLAGWWVARDGAFTAR